MAGLMTAAILSRHFAHVTIVESDLLPDQAVPRKGVPQSVHLHGLLTGGRTMLDAIYGDFTAAVLGAGAVPFDPARQQALLLADGWLRRAPSDLRTVTASRWTLEHVVRTQTRAISNITFRHAKVVDLQGTADRVAGAVVVDEGAGRTELSCDLLIDATGRGSRSPQWLEGLGFAPPQESLVSAFLGYATVRCRVPEDAWPGDYNAIVAPPFPGASRGGFITQEEDGLVGFMAAGSARDYPPGDTDGFTDFLRTAFATVLYDIWMKAEPVTDIRTTRTSQNRLRHWNVIPRRPKGFLPVGDSVAAFNPVYGQGITVAAMQATTLGKRLDETDSLDDVTVGLFDDIVEVSRFAWTAATGSDLGFATTEVQGLGGPAMTQADGEFLGAVRALAVTNAYAAVEFNRAIGFMRPELLRTPTMLRLVEQHTLKPTALEDISPRPPLWADADAPAADLSSSRRSARSRADDNETSITER